MEEYLILTDRGLTLRKYKHELYVSIFGPESSERVVEKLRVENQELRKRNTRSRKYRIVIQISETPLEPCPRKCAIPILGRILLEGCRPILGAEVTTNIFVL
jgi:hypothetical protein